MFNEGSCHPSPAAGCQYATFFILFGPPYQGSYPLLMEGIVFELLGSLILTARTVFVKRDSFMGINWARKKSSVAAIIVFVLGMAFMAFVAFIGIILTPSACPMQLDTNPAPSCAYFPYSVMVVWEGMYIMIIGIIVQFFSVFMLLSSLPQDDSETIYG